MRVEIVLLDSDGNAVLELSNCHEPEFVFLKILNDNSKIVVNICDLQAALRKISY